jgi:hypothetical protein
VKRAAIGILILLGVLGAGAVGVAKVLPPIPPVSPPPPATSERVLLRFSEEPESLSDLDTTTAPDTIIVPVRWRHDGSSGDLVRFGEDIVIQRGQRVHGDVVSIGGSIEVLGEVDRDAVSLGGRVRIRPGGVVRGQAISLGGKVMNEGTGGLRGSSVSMPAIPAWLFDLNVMNMVGQGIKILQLALFLALVLFLAWVLTHLAPQRTQRAVASVRSRPGHAFLWGVGAMIGLAPSAIAVVLVGALLCITIIGIPVAILLWVGYAVGLALVLLWGYFVGAYVVGSWAARRLKPEAGEPGMWRSLLFGVVFLFLPSVASAALMSLGFLAPISTGLGMALSALGWVISTCMALFGLGAVLATRAGSPPRPEPAIPQPPSPLPPLPPLPPAPPAMSAT